MLQEFAERFRKFTDGTDYEFREPSEQGIELVNVVGNKLDNSCGDYITATMIRNNSQEAVVIVKRTTVDGSTIQPFNLASLMALAKIGAVKLTPHLIESRRCGVEGPAKKDCSCVVCDHKNGGLRTIQ